MKSRIEGSPKNGHHDYNDDEDDEPSARNTHGRSRSGTRSRSRSRSRGGRTRSVSTNCSNTSDDKVDHDSVSIYIGNVDYGATEEDLKEAFICCGDIARVTIIKNMRTGHSKGVAFVEFVDKSSVDTAMSFNGKEIRGRAITVTTKKPKPERRARPSYNRSSPPPAFRRYDPRDPRSRRPPPRPYPPHYPPPPPPYGRSPYPPEYYYPMPPPHMARGRGGHSGMPPHHPSMYDLYPPPRYDPYRRPEYYDPYARPPPPPSSSRMQTNSPPPSSSNRGSSSSSASHHHRNPYPQSVITQPPYYAMHDPREMRDPRSTKPHHSSSKTSAASSSSQRHGTGEKRKRL